MRNFFLFILIGVSCFGVAQEIEFKTENDAYMLASEDGYYTNGLEAAINWKAKKSSKIHNVSIGQNLYTSEEGGSVLIHKIDRPVTGFLYGSYSQTFFGEKNDVFKAEATVGVIGPAAFGKDVQVFVHKVFDMYDPKGVWEYQLNNAVGVNLDFLWSKRLLNTSTLDLNSHVEAQLGTLFTKAKLGGVLKIGKRNDNQTSSYWKSRSNDKDLKKEMFFYIKPTIIFSAYDITIEGGLFRDDKGPVVGDLKPISFNQSIGAIISWKKFTVDVSANFQTKEAKDQNINYWYGSVGFRYVIN